MPKNVNFINFISQLSLKQTVMASEMRRIVDFILAKIFDIVSINFFLLIYTIIGVSVNSDILLGNKLPFVSWLSFLQLSMERSVQASLSGMGTTPGTRRECDQSPKNASSGNHRKSALGAHNLARSRDAQKLLMQNCDMVLILKVE